MGKIVGFDWSDNWANAAIEREAEEILSRKGWVVGSDPLEPTVEHQREARVALPAIDEGPGFHSSEAALALEESSLDPDADHTHLRGALGAILRDSRPDLMAKYHPDIPVA